MTITLDDMEITKLIDDYGDDIFALALIVTKDFDSAKKVFAKTCAEYESFSGESDMLEFAVKAYAYSCDADSNDNAVTLTGVELDAKRQRLLEQVLMLPQMKRAVIHMFYENDLDEKQIASVTGESERYISSVLSELPEELSESLDKNYKDICTKIFAEDKLKAYVIRSAAAPKKREFQVGEEAVPIHRWTMGQRIVVIVAAIVFLVTMFFVMPVFEKYFDMLEDEKGYSYEEPATDEIFAYTYEAHSTSSE